MPKLFAEMQGSLVSLNGRSLEDFTFENPEKIKVIAFYSSASWCRPCHKFTPTLVRKYRSLKSRYDNFEVVLLSSDRQREAWEEYIKEYRMPYPSLEFDSADKKGILAQGKNYNYIPSLFIRSADGEVLHDGSDGAYESLEKLEEILRETH